MNTITIINVSEETEDGFTSYTFPNFFADENIATTTIASMAAYWAQQNNGNYVGFVKDEDAYCVKKDGKLMKFYSIQTLSSFETENVIERIA